MKSNNLNKKPKLISSEEVDRLIFSEEDLKRLKKEHKKVVEGWKKEIMIETANKLKRARIRSGITQQKVAEELKTSTQNISAFENGKKNLTIFTLQKFARAIGKELEIRII